MNFEAGRGKVSVFLDSSRQLRDASLEVARTPAERRAAHLAHFKRAVLADEIMSAWFVRGAGLGQDLYSARAERLAAEVALRRAGGMPPEDVKPARDLKTLEAECDNARREAEKRLSGGIKPAGKN